MKEKKKQYDVGVIVGRFQVPFLHTAHISLINHVKISHDRLVILLGVSPVLSTFNNPLDFESRKRMINKIFPEADIYSINDRESDQFWSKDLDATVASVLKPMQTCVLYGGRDSFLSHYSGSLPTTELESDLIISGTYFRKQASNMVKEDASFRCGVIYASTNRYPTCFTTVDVAISDKRNKKILLAKKPTQTKLRFVGGFSDPKHVSFEVDARAEVQQETGLEITDPIYLKSFLIDDWRYRRETDKIKTIFFYAQMLFGNASPNDDISEIKWVDWSSFSNEDFIKNEIVPEHHELARTLGSFLKSQN